MKWDERTRVPLLYCFHRCQTIISSFLHFSLFPRLCLFVSLLLCDAAMLLLLFRSLFLFISRFFLNSNFLLFCFAFIFLFCFSNADVQTRRHSAIAKAFNKKEWKNSEHRDKSRPKWEKVRKTMEKNAVNNFAKRENPLGYSSHKEQAEIEQETTGKLPRFCTIQSANTCA